MLLVSSRHPEAPALEIAVSHALLGWLANENPGPLARVYVPGPTAAFGRLDTRRAGFRPACEIAAAAGFTPVIRLAGGRLAVYDHGSVIVELYTPTTGVAAGLEERFEGGTRAIAGALRSLGARVEIGELPGEYCPGRWSVHLERGPKIAGAAQRVVRGAAVFSAVIVTQGGDRVREALRSVLAALDVAWDPRTAGAVEDGVPGVTPADVEQALLRTLDLSETIAIPDEVLRHARSLEGRHRAVVS